MQQLLIHLREGKINRLKQKIDSVVEEGCWDLDDGFKDSDITKAKTIDCVVYYMAEYSNMYYVLIYTNKLS